MDILRQLRLGKIDVLVGINLLREGLDLPEVSLVAILDADKEGFLRNTRSLIQTIGRAARNVNGAAILYADRVTRSMSATIDETERRREIQIAFNEEHGITPETIRKSIDEIQFSTRIADARGEKASKVAEQVAEYADEIEIEEALKILNAEMKHAAESLDFERAASLRDQIRELQEKQLQER
jgi:excinuclease ABC subunit B